MPLFDVETPDGRKFHVDAPDMQSAGRAMARRGPHKPETIARMRAAACKHWSDPAARARHGELIKRRMARPGVSEKIAARTKEAMTNPAVRRRISEGTRAALADPDTRARHREVVAAAMASPVVRQRISERTREAMGDPAVRERIRAGMARAKVCAELVPFLAVWAVLSAEARAVALREIAVVRPP
jgi:hypothetical protein